MKVTVKLFTTLRELAGKGEVTVETNNKLTVATLLRKLEERYGEEFREYVYDENGNVKGFLQFLVNGKSVETFQGLKTRLKDGDTVAILPPVGGG
ncbi:MAG: ubiquitin-like small modifier protein 1 [Candidatus Bathyarchaeia archaeon]|nr:MoaD family protein [Candidatus Bathyarchaeota archaeon A05DMB-4]MDH7595258.1 MoaD family protein [Candidatus Bathyarchaeota archaeon]